MTHLGIGIVLAGLMASPLPVSQHLPKGSNVPTVGATCHGSSALGTSNTYGSGKATTIVNIWEITEPKSGSTLGWLVKSFDGRFWYEDPLHWKYHLINSLDEAVFAHEFTFVPCFSHDLTPT